ncbi:hypothetical protein [Streptomyces mirabilis]
MITNHPRETPEAAACQLRLLEEGPTMGELTMAGIARRAEAPAARAVERAGPDD